MKTALFFNFTSEPFTGYWDGKGKTFKPGQKAYMPEFLARHYAKHLANKVLLSEGKENSTSPKFPEQVPDFMEIFNKACIISDDAEDQDEVQTDMDVAEKSHGHMEPTVVDNKPPQIVTGPDGGDDEDFEGLDSPQS